MSLRGGWRVGVYPGSRSRRGEWDKTEMSSKNSELNRGVKGRKRQARSGESKEDSVTPSDPSKRLERDEKKADDPFRSPEGSVEKAHRRAANDWVGACEPLIAQMEEHTEALKEVIRSDKFCARCEELATCAASLATHHLEETGSALREYSLRYQQALRDLDTERKKKEKLARENEEWLERVDEVVEENGELVKENEKWRERVEVVIEKSVEGENRLKARAEEAEEERKESEERLRRVAEEMTGVELERDQLRAALATREESEREGRTPPPQDTEPEEVEMRGGLLPLPPAASPFRPFLGPWRNGLRRSEVKWFPN